MSCNEAVEMPTLNSTPSTPTVGVNTPTSQKILAPTVVEEESERIPFAAGELINTPLSDKPWRFCVVQADQIEPIQSDWYRIRLAPGIYIAGHHHGIYRVAVDESYVPRLSSNGFKFQQVDPTMPVGNVESVQGIRTAAQEADAHYVQDAVQAILSGCPPGLALAYRNYSHERHKLPIEWANLWRDLEWSNHSRTKFAQSIVILVLGCTGDYGTPAVLELLEKNETELLQGFRSLCQSFTVLPGDSIAKCEAVMRSAPAELHQLSLFRCLFDLFNEDRGRLQYNIDLRHRVIDNTNMLSSIVDIEVFKPFGGFDSQKLLNALSTSPLFPYETLQSLDVEKLSIQLMARLPIAFSTRCLDIPFEIQSELSFEQEHMIHAQIDQFYHEHPSLQSRKNDILVLLCCNSLHPSADPVLKTWAASPDSWTFYERLIKEIQVSQSKEQLVLMLGALLCYQRLSPSSANVKQPITGSYLADFDAILKFEYPSNAQTVTEHMVCSVLRIFWTVKDDSKIRQFLHTVLKIQPPPLELSPEFSDGYWTYRVRDRLAHGNALEMATLDDKEKQESGAITTDEGWVLVQTPQEESSPGAPDEKLRVSAFPPAVFHLELYRLIFVCLSRVSPREEILCTISLPNGCLAVIVLGSYVSKLERDLGKLCFPYNAEPEREEVELFGFAKAQDRRVHALARMAVDAVSRDNTLEKGLWQTDDPQHVLSLLTTWLGGVVARSHLDSPAPPKPTRIENDSRLGRVQLDGYNFNLYKLVRVSNLGQDAQNLDKLGNPDTILSIMGLEDGSWELPVSKSYLPELKDTLHKMVRDCIIEPDYDPTEPNAKEVEEFGYEKARFLKISRFHDRAKLITREAWPKAAAFYADLATGGEKEMVALESDGEIGMLENKELKMEKMLKESTDQCRSMVQTLLPQSPAA